MLLNLNVLFDLTTWCMHNTAAHRPVLLILVQGGVPEPRGSPVRLRYGVAFEQGGRLVRLAHSSVAAGTLPTKEHALWLPFCVLYTLGDLGRQWRTPTASC